MLKYVEKVEPATDDVTVIRGCDISRGKFSKRQRGQLAIRCGERRSSFFQTAQSMRTGTSRSNRSHAP
jgi:hypothetical protein